MAYENMLAFCSEAGGSCSLVDDGPKDKPAKGFLLKAKDYAIGVDQVTSWPDGNVSKGTVTLWRYALSAEFMSLLIEASRGLYSWRAPKLPEDLGLYRRDGTVLLSSIAHEYLSWMHLREDEVRAPLLGLVELRPENG